MSIPRLGPSLAFALALAACSGGARPATPVVSPTGTVYAPGIAPSESRASQTATLYLRQGRFEQALAQALEGMRFDSINPVHYFLAGAAYARLGRLGEADEMFDRAERIYPAYELDVEPEREAAWGSAFNAGLEAYADGDVEGTISFWRGATLIYDLQPEAHRNLATVLATEGRYDEAIEAYDAGLRGLGKAPATRVLSEDEAAARRASAYEMERQLAPLLLLTERFDRAEALLRAAVARTPDDVEARSDLARSLQGLGRTAEAAELYEALLDEGALQGARLFNTGVALFRSGDFEASAEAFRHLTATQPESRDAWFNYVNALFAAEAWDRLAPAGRRLLELEPLAENAILVTARAELENGDRGAAVRTLAIADSLPVFLGDLRMRRAGGETDVQGTVTGNAAAPGTRVEVRFVFFGDGGEIVRTGDLSLRAPEPGSTEPFRISVAARAAAYRYEVLPSP